MKNSLIFFSRFVFNPRQIGSIVPSSRYLSRSISDLVKTLQCDHLLELGPGTGSITKYIAELNPTLIELDSHLARGLRKRFPHLMVHNKCALNYLGGLKPNTGIIVSIPLINNPFTNEFVSRLKSARESGNLNWVVIYTYGRRSPLSDAGFAHSSMHKKVIANFPPAYVWIYS